jgi:type IV pilus assembly protein PilE
MCIVQTVTEIMCKNNSDGRPARITAGFSLIELMIAITVVAILVTLSYPSYIHFIRKADRSEAQVTLQDWANRQEVWRADHITYNTGINPSNTSSYTYSMTSTATSFTLTATAIARQAADTEAGVSCAIMTLRQDGSPGPGGTQSCWGK